PAKAQRRKVKNTFRILQTWRALRLRARRAFSDVCFQNYKYVWLVFAFVVFMSGCLVGPDYQRPQIDTPQIWRVEDKNVQAITNMAWWEQYNDPVLNELVQSGLQENKDIKIAAARIEQFLGLYTTTRAALFPQVGAGTTAGRQRLSEIAGPAPFEDTVNTFPNFNNFQFF